MSNHPIEGLMKTTMDSLKEMIDVNTIVGNPVNIKDGGVIIPISKVSIGFASGGSEFNKNPDELRENPQNLYPFGGGSGAGMSVQPVGFLVINDNHVRLLPVSHQSPIDKIIDSVPDFVDNISSMFKKEATDPKEEGFNPS